MEISSRHELRDYQERAVQQVIDTLNCRPLLVAPTGSGKSSMGTAIVERLGRRTLWLAHRKELVDQAALRLMAHGLQVGIVMAGYRATPWAQVQVASVQSLAQRKRPPVGLIMVDEAHHVTARGFASVLAFYPDAAVVGLTATPFRLDGRGLGGTFGELVVAAYADELCDAGVLCRPKVFASQSPDLHGIRVIAGDYSLEGLAQRTNTQSHNAGIVQTWQQRAAGKRTVAFAVDVPHSRAIVEAFQNAGVPAEHLDGTLTRPEREAILERLRAGRTLVVSNCMVLTEGWDLPSLECAILARPTASLNLHIQMVGRAMRACSNKEAAIVLDHAGNHHAHGLVTRRLNYSLGDELVRQSEPLGLRRCAACFLLYEPVHPVCPNCGWQAEPTESDRELPPIEGAGELIAFDDTAFNYRREVWLALETERIEHGFKEAWSEFRFNERFGTWPLVFGGELIDPKRATTDQKRSVFEQFTSVARERGYRPGWASWKFKDAFGVWPRGFVTEVKKQRMEVAA